MQDATSGSGGPHASPFAASALIYYRKGWTDVFPLGHRGGERYAKAPVPKGVTGYDAGPVGFERIYNTVHGPAGKRNIGARMPRHVICLDVDQYDGHEGLATLERTQADLGPLPDTFRNSARGWTASGHRYFRCPLGHVVLPGAEEKLSGAYGPNIDILHHGRRYAVVWPSLNPAAGLARYEWYSPGRELLAEPPAVVELPQLPKVWAQFLTVPMDSPEASARGGNLRAPKRQEGETGDDDLFDDVRQAWRRSVMEVRVREHLSAVLTMTDGTVNKTLGAAGIALGRYAVAGLFTLEQAHLLLERAAMKNGVHSDEWNKRNRKGWTLDSRIQDALSQGLNRDPIQIIDDVEPSDVFGYYLPRVTR